MSVTEKHSISRRGAISRMAVAAVAGVAAPTISSVAHAAVAPAGSGLNAFKGLYALRGGRVIDGYFVAPRGRTNLDVVVVLHGEGGFDAKARALANRYARAGKLAIVPDLGATYSGVDVPASRESRIADMKRLQPSFAKSMHGSGKVEYVSA